MKTSIVNWWRAACTKTKIFQRLKIISENQPNLEDVIELLSTVQNQNTSVLKKHQAHLTSLYEQAEVTSKITFQLQTLIDQHQTHLTNLFEQTNITSNFAFQFQTLIDQHQSQMEVIQKARRQEEKRHKQQLEHSQYLLERCVANKLHSVSPSAKLNCIFFVADLSLWDVFAPIYNLMAQSEDFLPQVLAFKRIDVTSDKSENEIVDFFTKRKINFVVEGFSGSPLTPLDFWKPDILIYTLGSGAYPEPYKIENTSSLALTCYLSYGFLLADEEDYQFNQSFHHSAWMIFASTDRESTLYVKHSKKTHQNIVVVGYPKFDNYLATTRRDMVTPTVIWAPHWSISTIYPRLNLGTFAELHKPMLEVIAEMPKINFIFKPHPNLKYACETLEPESSIDYDDYIDSINALPNAKVNNRGDYFDLFQNSAAMITDSVSFLAEYLPSGNPLLFLNKRGRAKMSGIGEKLIESHYTADTIDGICEFITNSVIERQDPKKDYRARACKELLNIDKEQSSKKVINQILCRLKYTSHEADAKPD